MDAAHQAADDAWKRFKNDFNNLSDAQIAAITQQEERRLEEAEDWLEAVASWEKAGKPRDNEEGDDV